MEKLSRLSIDDYAMVLAFAASMRSEDPSRKVGAVALDWENRVIATSYNGLPKGFQAPDSFWYDHDQRRKFVVHAEANLCSLTKRGQILTVAATTIPCAACAINLVAHGVKKVVYGEDYPRDVVGKEILEHYHIELVHIPLKQTINNINRHYEFTQP